MRPSGDTQTISVITRPAPPRAFEPRWTRWKSPGTPSTAEYMSIGETMTRFFSSSAPIRNGWNIAGAVRRRRPLATSARIGVDRRRGGELGVAVPQVLVGDPAASG